MGIVNFILHLDKYIGNIIQNYGVLTYFILFIIIFIETGLVIAPFLPGDSLLFLVGAFAAKGYINVFLLLVILSIAAILGDTLNYWIGNYFGERVFTKSKLIKPEHIEKTKIFYHKHGGKTIILARFIPIVRTFAPFIAGVGKMKYSRFFSYNVLGGILWVALFLFAGYFFGGIPIVQENLTAIVLIIIFTSAIPPLVEYLRKR